MRALGLFLMAVLAAPLGAQSEPQPRVVEPGPQPGRAPSDAVALFDGKDLSEWTGPKGSPSGCRVADGAIVCETGSGDLWSRRKFRDAQIHLEWMEPSMPAEHSQSRGNSGVYLHGRYEIQILDSYRNPTYPNGSCGALYGQAPPLVNASRPPEQWQSYDIVFHPPKCSPEGGLLERGNVTVLHNGVLVQDHTVIHDIGRGCVVDKIGEPGPIMLQDHNYPGAPRTTMRFRNIWLRPLEEGELK
jgi:3-keto-disaccharide hydrolase